MKNPTSSDKVTDTVTATARRGVGVTGCYSDTWVVVKKISYVPGDHTGKASRAA